MPRKSRGLLLLIGAALLFAVLEGLMASPPAWFVQVCGALTIVCPLFILVLAFRKPPTGRLPGDSSFIGAGPATPIR